MGKEEDADQDREDQKRGRPIAAQLEATLTERLVQEVADHRAKWTR
jgi:hypothetical protein